METEVFLADESAMRQLAARCLTNWSTGDTILLYGELGAGKTTFVRGALGALGVTEGVRSPTFNLMQEFATDPPVLHADLYRLQNAQGIGLEDYLATHLCFIEWPDRAHDLIDPSRAWQVKIRFEGEGRAVQVVPPAD